MFDLLICNGTIIDGSGGPAFRADVAVLDGKIAEIGDLKGRSAKMEIDASGKTVTPGFIDSHSHADLTIARFPDAENLTLQGVTTFCAGQCSMGIAPLTDYYFSTLGDIEAVGKVLPPTMTAKAPQVAATILPLQPMRKAYKDTYGVSLDWSDWASFNRHLEQLGIGPNMMCLVGHGMIRAQIMGPDHARAASKEEVDRMCDLLRQCMEQGANGLSYGFDYVPSSFAEEEELLRLAAVVKEYDGMLTAHVQHSGLRRGKMDPSFQPYQGYREFLEIGSKTGVHVHVSHVRAPFKPIGERTASDAAAKVLTDLFEEYRKKGVRVTWDVLPDYPVAGEFAPMLASRLQCYVERAGGLTRFGEALQNELYFRQVKEEILAGSHLDQEKMSGLNLKMPGWDKMLVVTKHQCEEYQDKSIAEIAAEEGTTSLDIVLKLLREDVTACVRFELERFIGFEYFANHSEVSIGLDVSCCNYDCNLETRPDMPPVYLGSYSDFAGMIYFLKSEKVLLSREEKIAAMTGKTAKNLGLHDRGLIREGKSADLLILDWDHLEMNVNHIEPNRAPKGIDYVFVNGKLTAKNGIPINSRAGRIIRNGDRLHTER